MATLKLVFKQKRETFSEDSNLKFRVTTVITDFYEETSGSDAIANFIRYSPPLFLLKKINTYQPDLATEPEYIKQSRFMRVATPEDFRETNPNDFDYTIPAATTLTWMQLEDDVNRSVQVTKNSAVETLTSPPNTHVAPNEYYISNVLITEYDYIEDADTGAENIRLGLQIFRERMNDFLNGIFSTMNNSTTYPDGWSTYTL